MAEQSGLTKAQARAAYDAMTAVITEQLSKGNTIVLTGFGKFETRQRQGRMGVNPATGERMVIKPMVTPGFKASSTLKQAVAATG